MGATKHILCSPYAFINFFRFLNNSNQIKFYWSHTHLADVIVGVAKCLSSINIRKSVNLHKLEPNEFISYDWTGAAMGRA